MSLVGKIFLALACLGGIVSAFFAFKVVEQKKEKKTSFLTEESAHTTTKNSLKSTQQEVAQEKETKKTVEGSVADSIKKVEGIESQLKEVKTKVSSLEKDVESAKGKVAEEEKKFSALKDQMGNDTPDSMRASIKKAEGELQGVISEKKRLEDDVAAQKSEVARLKDVFERAKKGEMPAIIGKVLVFNKTWNFAVLNVGDRDGVVPNGILTVYRGNDFVSKLKVISTEDHQAIADVIRDMNKGEIQVGDEIFNPAVEN